MVLPRRSAPAVLCFTFIATIAASYHVAGMQPSSPNASPEILVTRQLMEARGLRVGDTVRLGTEPNGGKVASFRIAGAYEPAPDPMRFAQRRLEARLHLPDLIDLTAEPGDPGALETVTALNVRLAAGVDPDRFARDVAARVPGVVARPTTAPDERTSTFVVLERFHLAIAIVTIIGSAVFLLALMVMLVEERRASVGILRLIGFTRRRILLQVFTEGALIAIAGATFGVLFAMGSQGVFNRFFQWRYDTALVFVRITTDVVLQSAAIAIPLGILATVLASWTLLRRELLALIRR